MVYLSEYRSLCINQNKPYVVIRCQLYIFLLRTFGFWQISKKWYFGVVHFQHIYAIVTSTMAYKGYYLLSIVLYQATAFRMKEKESTADQLRRWPPRKNEQPNSLDVDSNPIIKRLAHWKTRPLSSSNQSKPVSSPSLLDQGMHKRPCKELQPMYLLSKLQAERKKQLDQCQLDQCNKMQQKRNGESPQLLVYLAIR